jgi:hypothetical protein
MHRALIFLVLVAGTTGCTTPARLSPDSVAEAARRGICCVHVVPMKKESVPILYGFVVSASSDASRRACESLFPFDRRPVVAPHEIPVEFRPTAEIFVCPQCEDAKARWIMWHPFDPWAKAEREKAKRPNKAPEPTTMTVTPRAPSSTSRAGHGRGSS